MHESEGRKHDLSENWEALNAKLQFEAHTHSTDNIKEGRVGTESLDKFLGVIIS